MKAEGARWPIRLLGYVVRRHSAETPKGSQVIVQPNHNGNDGSSKQNSARERKEWANEKGQQYWPLQSNSKCSTREASFYNGRWKVSFDNPEAQVLCTNTSYAEGGVVGSLMEENS